MQWYIVLYRIDEWGGDVYQCFKCEGDPIEYWRKNIRKDHHTMIEIFELGKRIY